MIDLFTRLGERHIAEQQTGSLSFAAMVMMCTKLYGEFANENRPVGWNVWLTFNLQPAAAPPPATSRPRFTK